MERWHKTRRNRVLLDSHYLHGDPERQIDAFVAHCNNHRCHERLGDLMPATGAALRSCR